MCMILYSGIKRNYFLTIQVCIFMVISKEMCHGTRVEFKKIRSFLVFVWVIEVFSLCMILVLFLMSTRRCLGISFCVLLCSFIGRMSLHTSSTLVKKLCALLPELSLRTVVQFISFKAWLSWSQSALE